MHAGIMDQHRLTTCHVFCLWPQLLSKYSIPLLIKAEAPAIMTLPTPYLEVLKFQGDKTLTLM